MKGIRVFCKICNKGLLRDHLVIINSLDQINFMLDHVKETNGKHNAFGIEGSEIDLKGAYMNFQGKRLR